MTTKQNGLDAANVQPVKTPTKYATDFIAICARFTSIAGILSLYIAALLLHAVLVRLGVVS